MRYVLDAAIAVASVRPNEPLHLAARARLVPLFRGEDAIVVPALFAVEVTAILARRGMPAAHLSAFVELLLARATVITIGPKRARAVCAVATATQLRASDATYVWIASRERIPLLTDDAEIVVRGAPLCQVDRL